MNHRLDHGYALLIGVGEGACAAWSLSALGRLRPGILLKSTS
ncbi:MAG: hypothetical protein NZ528_14105 [Caldilineales bacterium]|nr:hypothetical protein [Caldilineales bacterium]MDW8319627.1 hypothetical protein [Anaerolineae bacterium]